jgi:TRAP-type C4-dicarboxylate transport system permease small subunit
MGSLSKQINRLLHAAIAVCLTCMATFVFANVILRYFFNEGLTWAEEASRYLFIWLIFLGAIVAYQENVHLGVDTLVNKLSVKGKRILFIVNNIILVITMGLCVHGTWKMTVLTADQVSSSMQIPMSLVYVSGFLSTAAMVVISLVNLYRLFTNKLAEDELVMMTDTEDKTLIDQAISEAEEGAKKS